MNSPEARVLAAFPTPPEETYGRALSQHTGLGSGTVLRCLYRLERELGLIVSRWEDEASAAQRGAPPRRLYRLTMPA